MHSPNVKFKIEAAATELDVGDKRVEIMELQGIIWRRLGDGPPGLGEHLQCRCLTARHRHLQAGAVAANSVANYCTSLSSLMSIMLQLRSIMLYASFMWHNTLEIATSPQLAWFVLRVLCRCGHTI